MNEMEERRQGEERVILPIYHQITNPEACRMINVHYLHYHPRCIHPSLPMLVYPWHSTGLVLETLLNGKSIRRRGRIRRHGKDVVSQVSHISLV